jgi:hypothetical protein
MYPLRLKHADHGYHYVYDSNDEAAHRAIGWADENAAPQVKPEQSPSPATPAPDGAAPVKRKPGRPRKA